MDQSKLYVEFILLLRIDLSCFDCPVIKFLDSSNFRVQNIKAQRFSNLNLKL